MSTVIKTEMNIKRSPRLAKESPIMLEKLLSGSKEPYILASPNAFDWEKRLTMPGGSPNAFALSLNGNEAVVAPSSGANTLYDYPPATPQEHAHAIDLATMMMMENMVASMHQEPLHDYNNAMSEHSDSQYFDSPSSTHNGTSDLFEPLPPKRTYHDRKDSHRESERRRRESFKIAMHHLENLVVLTLNRAGSCKILGKGPNRKLSHAEVYQMARDIIVTLKEETVKIEHMNQEMRQSL